jgi:DMSO reductase anchor subunit
VRPFQDVLIELGARLRLPGLTNADGSPRYSGGYPDYLVNHERKPGNGPLAGWRGTGGDQAGAGYGLLALCGVLAPLGVLPRDPWFGVAALGAALLLITAGLLSSTVHLGHPQRAWRAVSQWRTSWLSHEGVAALLTYLPAGVFGIGWVFLGRTDGVFAVCGLLAAAMAVMTVYCTGMIYASLKPVHQWHNAHVVPLYMALGLMSGALWLNALLQLWSQPSVVVAAVAAVAIPLAVWMKERYWRFIDGTSARSTPETAIGLFGRGKVRALDFPHTGENYLLKEMGFAVARKHALKLRRTALGLGFVVPLVLTLVAALLPGAIAVLASVLATVAAMTGVLVGRWLSFAEAKHTVMLYYGASAA